MEVVNNINSLNYLSVTMVSPEIKIGNIEHNTEQIVDTIRKHSNDTNLLIFPELTLTGATCGDWFFEQEHHNEIIDAIKRIVMVSYEKHSTLILGSPFPIDDSLIDAALFISEGKLLGVVPRTKKCRWFNVLNKHSIMFNGYDVPISDLLIFTSFCKIGIIVGKPDVISLSKLTNAEVIACIDATPYSICNSISEEIHSLSKTSQQAIIYVNAGANESSTDGVFFPQHYVKECGGELVTETMNDYITRTTTAEIDLDIIRGKLCKNIRFVEHNENTEIRFDFAEKEIRDIHREYRGFKEYTSDENCRQILEMQATAIARRLRAINIQNLVLGVSGGVDSTIALLASVRSFDMLKYDRKNIHTISLPGFGTTTDSNTIAQDLAESLGVNYKTISIAPMVRQHFKDIEYEHTDANVVYENAQARARAMVLFDYANKVNGLVVGTGDMSEIALGWATYNGDHISNYNPNAGIPKTIMQSMLRFFASNSKIFALEGKETMLSNALTKVVERPISPELLPQDAQGKGQETEEILGPYEIHDFFIYYYLNYFMSDSKLLFIAKNTFRDKYYDALLEECLVLFRKRFRQNQYKRSCACDGPAIFGISMSPRGELMYPSDM